MRFKNFKKLPWLVFSYFLIATPALAIETGLDETGKAAGLKPPSGATIAERVGVILGAVLALVGVIFLVLMIYGGFLWMTAAGDTDKVKKAKELITSAIIGLVIISAGYIITSFVLQSVFKATVGP